MEALVGQEAQFVSNPVRKAEPVKSVTHGCIHRCTGRQLKDKPSSRTKYGLQPHHLTRSSAVAHRPRDASCLSVVSFNSTKRRAESFIVSYV